MKFAQFTMPALESFRQKEAYEEGRHQQVLTVHLLIHLVIILFIHASVHSSVRPSIHASIHPFVHSLFVCSFIHLFIHRQRMLAERAQLGACRGNQLPLIIQAHDLLIHSVLDANGRQNLTIAVNNLTGIKNQLVLVSCKGTSE